MAHLGIVIDLDDRGVHVIGGYRVIAVVVHGDRVFFKGSVWVGWNAVLPGAGDGDRIAGTSREVC